MKKQVIALAIAALGTGLAHAGPANYVHTPNVEYGEHEIEFKVGSERDKGKEQKAEMILGYGQGVTPWWFTELNVGYQREREHGAAFKYDAIEWENVFQLTERGKYPVDLGVLAEIERPHDHKEGWEVKLGLLTQKDFDKVQANFNLMLERHFDAAEKSVTEMGYEWQLKYRLMPAFEYGLQGFGEVGKWDHWKTSDEQEHNAGPAIFGKLPLGGHQALKYDVGFLFGMTKATPDHTLRAKIEYEF